MIPYEFNDLAGTVAKYTEDLQNLLKHKQEEIEERNLEIEDGVFTAISDPQHPKGPPEVEAMPPAINFAPLGEKFREDFDCCGKALSEGHCRRPGKIRRSHERRRRRGT